MSFRHRGKYQIAGSVASQFSGINADPVGLRPFLVRLRALVAALVRCFATTCELDCFGRSTSLAHASGFVRGPTASAVVRATESEFSAYASDSLESLAYASGFIRGPTASAVVRVTESEFSAYASESLAHASESLAHASGYMPRVGL